MKKILSLSILFLSINVYGQITPEWVAVYDSIPSLNYHQFQMKISPIGNVYVDGFSMGLTGDNNILLKYNTNGNLIWTQTYSMVSTDVGEITIDDSENIYVTGRHYNINNYYEYLTLKCDSAGILQWTASYSNPGVGGFGALTDYPHAIAVDDSGNVYVTGQSPGNTINDYDVATIKYNSAGIEQWVRRYDYQGLFDQGWDLAVDSLFNIYISGCARDTLNNGYMLTLKYDSAGNLIWDAKYTEGGYGGARFIKMDLAGNLFVSGFTHNGNSQYKLLKYDNNGILIWEIEYDDSVALGGSDGVTDMILDSYSNIYMTGTRCIGCASDDYATVKFDSSGQLIWLRTYDGGIGGWDDASSIAIDTTGNIFVTGKSSVPSNFEFLTIKYDNNGNQVWTAHFGIGYNIANSIGLDALGNIYVSGWNQNATGESNIVTIKYGSTTGIQENNFSNQFIISPNPASTEFQISNYNFQTGNEITLMDVLGKIIFTKIISAPTSHYSIPATPYSNGIYFLQLKTKERVVSKKVMIQHP